MKAYMMKVGLEILNFLFNHKYAFMVMKAMNLFDAVFVVYPASQSYAEHFAFRSRLARNKWIPFIIGITEQHGRKSLLMAISSTESEIRDPSNGESLREFNHSTIEITKLVGATTTHYSGIIPGVLRHRLVERDEIEQRATIDCVMNATLKLRSDRKHGNDNPVIVLGSKGYIGKHVICKLRELSVTAIGVDAGERFVTPEVEHIVLNIALPEAVNCHIQNFNEKTILLNEVYPAPTGAVLKAIAAMNTTVIHIVGVRAKAFPAFPREYRGGVPCCGAIPGLPLQVLLKQIYP